MISALVGAAASAVGGIIQGIGAGRAARKQRRRSQKLQRDLNRLEANRQDIIDPSRNVVDRSSLISNTMGNLQVSTQAAEFQAEEADLSLASTLDTLRATGAGAGGATALAQAALRSKAGIAATIDQQEAQNARLRAQGAQAAQAARLQEGGRVDTARMRGDEFQFGVRERREQMQLDRTAGLLDQSRAQAASLRSQARAGFGQALGAIGGVVAGGLVGGQGFKENFNTNFGIGQKDEKDPG
tara:strand:- start:322 stop:1047 length:726 start_codon:yes stop_codon:yes gene_type:complete